MYGRIGMHSAADGQYQTVSGGELCSVCFNKIILDNVNIDNSKEIMVSNAYFFFPYQTKT